MTITSAPPARLGRLALELGGGRRLDHLDAVRRRDGEVGGEQGHLRTTPLRLGGEGDAHPTGGAVAEEADGVDRLARAAGADEHVPAGERSGGRAEELLDPRGDLLRLGHAADADLAFGELARLRSDQLDAALAQRRRVRLRRRVRPHARVHRRRDQHRAAVRERSLGEDVVCEPVRELRQRVRRQRRDHEQVGPLQMWIWIVRVRIGGSGLAREREEGLGADEALGAPRRQRQHVVAGLDEQPHELAGLVGRDAAGDPEQDARHRLIVPANVGTRPRLRGSRPDRERAERRL